MNIKYECCALGVYVGCSVFGVPNLISTSRWIENSVQNYFISFEFFRTSSSRIRESVTTISPNVISFFRSHHMMVWLVIFIPCHAWVAEEKIAIRSKHEWIYLQSNVNLLIRVCLSLFLFLVFSFPHFPTVSRSFVCGILQTKL